MLLGRLTKSCNVEVRFRPGSPKDTAELHMLSPAEVVTSSLKKGTNVRPSFVSNVLTTRSGLLASQFPETAKRTGSTNRGGEGDPVAVVYAYDRTTSGCRYKHPFP